MADIKNSFSKGLTMLNMKTSSFLELNKIKTYINTLNSEIATLKSEIGELVYRSWTSGQEPLSEDVVEKLNLIQSKLALIAEQEAAAAKISSMEKQILGEQEKTPEQTQTEPVLICSNCGQVYERPAKFCTKCGNRMN